MRIYSWIATFICTVACGAWGQSYTWTDITPPASRIYRVGIHPVDGRIIVAGSSESGALLRYSNDRGRTWNAPLAEPPYATSLFVHPGRPGVVFLEKVGLIGSVRFGTATTKGELYRSDDFGRSWSLAYTARDGESIRIFGADPLDARGAYALRIPGQSCIVALGCRNVSSWEIARTNNDGVEWTTVSALPGNSFTTYSWAYGPTPANPTRLFVGTFDSALASGDRGATWSPFAPSLPLRPQTAVPARLEAVVPDPLRANVLYALQYYFDPTQQINHEVTFRSDDGAASWREIYDSHYSNGIIAVHPARTRTLWLGPEPDGGTSFALHRSDDAGETWHAVPYPGGPYDYRDPSLPYFVFQGLFLSPSEPDAVYVLQGYRLYRGAPSAARDPIVVEYHYDIDRYWITSLDGEAVSQDYRWQPGQFRTGSKWGAWRSDDAPAGAVGSCRFWSSPRSGLRTRVLVQQGFECEALKRSPDWILEAENEFFTVPPAAGACGDGLVPVRRFNNRQPDANHRWVVDEAIAAEMRGFRAWYDEGVRFCARPLGANE